MDRAILFRFHRDAEVCASRIELLKQLNPEIPVYGLGEDIEGVEKLGEAGMEHLHVIDDKLSDWKWKNGDLAARRWFQEVGRDLEFDMLHIVEWDLLLVEPLEDLYSHVSEDQVALTGLKPVQKAKEYGWTWVNGEHEQEWRELKQKVRKDFSYTGSSHGCIFPGAALPRSFLDKYAKTDVPELSNDEVRVPLYAEAMGYELVDTGFFGQWGDEELYRYLNAKGQEIETGKIREELQKKKGRRTFHPVRKKIGKEKLMEWKT